MLHLHNNKIFKINFLKIEYKNLKLLQNLKIYYKKKINYNRVALANLNIIRSHDEYLIFQIFIKRIVGLIKNFPKYIVDNFNFLGNDN